MNARPTTTKRRGARPGRPAIEVPLTRAGAAAGLIELLRESGIEPGPLLAEAGLPANAFDQPEAPVAFRAICRLCELACARTGRDDLGLLVGQRMLPGRLGPLGYLALNAPTVEAALEVVVRRLHLNNTAVVAYLRREGKVAEFGVALVEPGVPGAEHYAYASVASVANLVRAIAGDACRLLEVHYAYRGPRDPAAFRAFYGVPVVFGSDRNAVLFSAECLANPIPGADPVLREILGANLDAMTALGENSTLQDRVRRVMRMLIAADECSETSVARVFGMDRRTLARRLQGEGTTFRALHDALRFDLATAMLRDTAVPIVDIADRLGYADASAFTRAFRRWSGATPASWRRRRGGAQAEAA